MLTVLSAQKFASRVLACDVGVLATQAVAAMHRHSKVRRFQKVLLLGDSARSHRLVGAFEAAGCDDLLLVDVDSASAPSDKVLEFASQASAIVDVRGFAAGESTAGSQLLTSIVAVAAERRRASPVLSPSVVSLRSGAAWTRDEVSASPAPALFAVDGPSPFGAHTDGTLLLGGAVPAALLTFPAAARAGELLAIQAGDAPVDHDVPLLVTRALARQLLPARPLDGHKGTFGTLLICAGSKDYWGAPLLAARGALRAGAGIVALAAPRALSVAIASSLPEVTMPDVWGGSSGHWDADVAQSVLERTRSMRTRAVLIGPGMADAQSFLRAYLGGAAALPLVLDADALNALPGLCSDWWRLLPSRCVLTPHPGEMQRLCATSTPPIAKMTCDERIALAVTSAAAWRAVVLLKGAFTVIAAPDGAVRVLPFASAALAVGGSGDVLAGVIAALCCQGLAPFDAAVAGAFLHGTAGLQIEAKQGAAGVLAHELAEQIPQARLAVLTQ
jgi:hydroxyethylthiazole kinase-like uncharacterized protein yjeF